MPAINPTKQLFSNESLRFGPYGRFRDRYELAEFFLKPPALITAWDNLTDPHTVGESEVIMVSNPDWMLYGEGSLSVEQVLSVDGGFLLDTNGDDNDIAGIFPRGTINSVVSTAWARLTLEPQHESRVQWIFEIPSIANITIQMGLGLTGLLELGGASQIDADYAKLQFSSEGAVSTTLWTAMEGIAGTDTEVVTSSSVVAIDETINLEIRYSSTSFARFYINGVKVYTALAAHTAAAALHPVAAVMALTAAGTKNLLVRQVRVSRVWQDG